MAKKEEKVIERIYTIPLRKQWLKAPKYRRAKKAVKTIKEFILRHMKIYDGDLNKVKIDDWVNKAVWCRGIKSPPHKITVKVSKKGDIAYVEFVNLPKKFKEEDKKLRKKLEKSRIKRSDKEKKMAEEAKKREEQKKLEQKVEEKSEEEKVEDEKKKEREKELHKQTREQEKQVLKLSRQKKQVQHRMVLDK